ncbi:MAG: 50S ribosomal protein L29 [Proteobacteria bacterium]|nr:50S ribosomal protein L29 [Pseudomonadota bacterium]
MKYEEIKSLSVNELKTKVAELREEIFRLRWQRERGQLENTSKICNIRRDLARVLTAIKEKNK